MSLDNVYGDIFIVITTLLVVATILGILEETPRRKD